MKWEPQNITVLWNNKTTIVCWPIKKHANFRVQGEYVNRFDEARSGGIMGWVLVLRSCIRFSPVLPRHFFKTIVPIVPEGPLNNSFFWETKESNMKYVWNDLAHIWKLIHLTYLKWPGLICVHYDDKIQWWTNYEIYLSQKKQDNIFYQKYNFHSYETTNDV